MIGRSLLLAGLFAAVGTGILLRPKAKVYRVDESWLERQYPTTLGSFAMRRDPEDGSLEHSYRMDPVTYQMLKPYGIVGRVLDDGHRAFDVVTVAGDTTDSFHNPLQCFQAQGWKIDWTREIDIATKSRGDVRATLAKATKDGGAPQYALYTYEGPNRMCPSPYDLGKDMFKAEFLTGRIQFATFFRFMSATQNVDESGIVRFAHDYIEACPVRPIANLKA